MKMKGEDGYRSSCNGEASSSSNARSCGRVLSRHETLDKANLYID